MSEKSSAKGAPRMGSPATDWWYTKNSSSHALNRGRRRGRGRGCTPLGPTANHCELKGGAPYRVRPRNSYLRTIPHGEQQPSETPACLTFWEREEKTARSYRSVRDKIDLGICTMDLQHNTVTQVRVCISKPSRLHFTNLSARPLIFCI